MIEIDWHAIFITAAGVFTLFIFGVLILIGACLKIAGEISRREEERAREADLYARYRRLAGQHVTFLPTVTPSVDMAALEAELVMEFGFEKSAGIQ